MYENSAFASQLTWGRQRFIGISLYIQNVYKKTGIILDVFEPKSYMRLRNPRMEPQRYNYTHFAQRRLKLLNIV